MKKNPILRSFFFLLLRLTGLPFILREFVQRKKVTFILYHDIAFENASRHFLKLAKLYNIISLKNFIESPGDTETLKKRLIITFDDGHKSNFELIPLFKKLNAKPVIFICTGIIGTHKKFWWKTGSSYGTGMLTSVDDSERTRLLKTEGIDPDKEDDIRQALSLEEIENMKNNVDFQSHSVTHPVLNKCSDQKQWTEIFESKTFIEEKLGLNAYCISYPNGNYDEKTIEMAKKAGYRCGITVDAGYNNDKTDPFKLKRLCINDDGGINELIVMASGMWIFLKDFFRQKKH